MIPAMVWIWAIPVALTVWTVIDSVFGNELTDDTWQDELED